MTFIILSALCSVCVAILLKFSLQRGFDSGQLIAWNYLAAALLCAGFLRPSFSHVLHPDTPWVSLLLLSVLLPTIFLALSRSLKTAGLVKTEIAQRLSLLLSLAAAFIWFGETINALKIAGLALGLLAILGLITGTAKSSESNQARIWPVLMVVWFGYASVDVLLKDISAAGVPFTLSLLISFSLAFIGMMGWQVYRHIRALRALTISHCGIGLGLGVLNFSNVGFYILAHQSLAQQPAIVFAMMNILVVVLGTLAGTFLFNEKLTRRTSVAIALALVAIILLALSRS
jgi:drug/metabolite transporter (DMT)-like permease